MILSIQKLKLAIDSRDPVKLQNAIELGKGVGLRPKNGIIMSNGMYKACRLLSNLKGESHLESKSIEDVNLLHASIRNRIQKVVGESFKVLSEILAPSQGKVPSTDAGILLKCIFCKQC